MSIYHFGDAVEDKRGTANIRGLSLLKMVLELHKEEGKKEKGQGGGGRTQTQTYFCPSDSLCLLSVSLLSYASFGALPLVCPVLLAVVFHCLSL